MGDWHDSPFTENDLKRLLLMLLLQEGDAYDGTCTSMAQVEVFGMSPSVHTLRGLFHLNKLIRTHKVFLTNLHAVMTQQGVGGCDMKEKLRHAVSQCVVLN